MRVKAKFAEGKFGFAYDRRVYDGDEFDLEDDSHFSPLWMEKIGEGKRRGRKPRSEQLVDDENEEGAE